MARVDYEEVVRRLERKLVESHPAKTSWGVRELRLVLADLRIECEVSEAPSERLFRLYGQELADVFFDRVMARGEGDSSIQDGREDAPDREAPWGPGPGVMPCSSSDHREGDAPGGSAAWQRQESSPQSSPARLAAVTTR